MTAKPGDSITEVFRNRHGHPSAFIVVGIPADAWIQESGKPGFAIWTVVPIVGWDINGVSDTYVFERAGGSSSMDTTDDPSKAALLASGTVRWDGCVNWETDGDGCMLHNCGGDDLRADLGAIERAYAMAAKAVCEDGS